MRWREWALGLLFVVAQMVTTPSIAQLRGTMNADAKERVPSAPEDGFRVKQVENAPIAPGVRRIIQTFKGWTLICDEAKRSRVCNASQSILAADGSLAFSWSLAATKGGEPVFLLRAPVVGFPTHTVALSFGDAETVIRLEDCDAQLCIGFLPLNPIIVQKIKDRGPVSVRYYTAEGNIPVNFVVSLDGLSAAIGSIR